MHSWRSCNGRSRYRNQIVETTNLWSDKYIKTKKSQKCIRIIKCTQRTNSIALREQRKPAQILQRSFINDISIKLYWPYIELCSVNFRASIIRILVPLKSKIPTHFKDFWRYSNKWEVTSAFLSKFGNSTRPRCGWLGWKPKGIQYL